jgi:acetyl-CoA carboxylase alpha subunit
VVTNKSEAPKKTQLAAQMGISVDTLQNYKLLSEMIPELSDLVDTGIVTKTTALTIMKELSEVNPCFYFYWSKII